MYCLDTSFLVDLARKDAKAIAKYWAISGNRLFASTISFFEFLGGEHRTPQEKEIALRFVSSIDELDFGRKEAMEATEIKRALRGAGKKIEDADILIAATAKTNRLKLVTRDKDFRKIPGLEVEEY